MKSKLRLWATPGTQFFGDLLIDIEETKMNTFLYSKSVID